MRVHAALTALAFVLSSLFGLIHEGTTRHVRCAEHGELIDGGPAAGATPSSMVASHARLVHAELRRGAAVRELDAIALHGHEHCTLASAMRESRVVPRAPVVAPAPVAVGALELAAASAAASHHRDLYRTAPKTSPPV
jgi:hypothetical protein